MTNVKQLNDVTEVDVTSYLILAVGNETRDWISRNLKNYLTKISNSLVSDEKPKAIKNDEEIRQIISYLNSPEAPQRLQKMSYSQAKSNSEKWIEAQRKRGETIGEKITDYEVFTDFGNGFKFVKLVGENSYKKEGHLMHNCVAGYYGRENSDIYSLRDGNNNPHATIEILKNSNRINQIKGKGNGSIHSSYAPYILDFISKAKMKVNRCDFNRFGYFEVVGSMFERLKSIKGLAFFTFEEVNYIYIKSKPTPKLRNRVV